MKVFISLIKEFHTLEFLLKGLQVRNVFKKRFKVVKNISMPQKSHRINVNEILLEIK